MCSPHQERLGASSPTNASAATRDAKRRDAAAQKSTGLLPQRTHCYGCRPVDMAKLQERAYGGLSTATARKLERASADPLGGGAVKPAPPISLKSGTRLVREWRGVTHTVLIHADGIEWRGQRYRSLSVVAREI